jgi:hypothetical protein
MARSLGGSDDRLIEPLFPTTETPMNKITSPAAIVAAAADLPKPPAWAIRCMYRGRSAFAPADAHLKDERGQVVTFPTKAAAKRAIATDPTIAALDVIASPAPYWSTVVAAAED